MTTLRLRDYQDEAVSHLADRHLAGDVRVPLVMATGLGKTVVFASYIDRWLDANPGRRALVIAHTDELITQAIAKIRAVAAGRRVGRVQGQQYNEVLAEIVVSSRQTLAGAKRREQLRHVGLIVVDECHHATRTNTYGKILEHFGAFDDPSPVAVAGFTATLARSDKQKLSSVWQDCTFSRDILFGIRHGYLLDVRGERITVPDLDLSNVRVRGGDYSEADLGEELERTFAPEVIAGEYLRLAAGRRGIAFWPLVDTAYSGEKAFTDAGIRSATVHGGTPKRERRELLQRFSLPLTHPEAIDVMHNAMVLTEGFDEPTADVVVIARPTKSAPLYQQMVGRVLRPDLTVPPAQRGKALILDVHGAGGQFGLRSLIDLTPERKLADAYDDHEDASLLELDEFQQAIEDELAGQRAGASFEFEGAEDYRGPATSVAFDPLGRDKVWGQTPAGVHYINTGNAYVFLVPSSATDPDAAPHLFDVVLCSPKAYRDGEVVPWAEATDHVQLPLEMALNWGEGVAEQVSGTKSLIGRKSKWRKGPASQAQLKFAHSLRVPGVEKIDSIFVSELTKGEVSEAIDSIMAARRIDPLVAVVSARVQANGVAQDAATE